MYLPNMHKSLVLLYVYITKYQNVILHNVLIYMDF